MDQLYITILNKLNWDTDFTEAYSFVVGTIMAVKRPISKKKALKALHYNDLKPDVVKIVLKQLRPVLSNSAEN